MKLTQALQAIRMSSKMNLQGLLAVLEDGEADLFARREAQFAPVPLTRVHFEVRLVEGLAEVSLVQEYVNVESKAIEVIYYFPIEESAVVTKVEAVVEGRRVVGKVKEKQEAREKYRSAVAQGRTAMKVEEVKADILELKVGRLAAGAGCKVTLTYLLEADVEQEKTRLTLPTTLAPRYCPPSHKTSEAVTISQIGHTSSSPPLSLRLEVFSKSPIVSLDSPSHALITSQDDIQDDLHHKQANFKGTTVDMDRDIVVLVATETGHRPRLIVEKCADSTAILLTLVPRVEDLVTLSSEVVFLIDCSGSMSGQSILMAKEALSLLLNSLPTDSTFNIVRFGSRMEMLFPSSQPYNDTTLELARQHVKSLRADLGGTEILTPLKAILNQSTEGGQRLKQLFVLTDGEVSNSQECIRLVNTERKKTRVFTLGIGSSADRHLVKGLARAGGGTSAFTTEGEQLARKVVGQLRQALAPSLHPVQVDWGLQGGGEHCQVPRVAPAIFHGSRFSIFRLFAGDVSVGAPHWGGKVVLKAGDTEHVLEVEKEPTLSGQLLHKMFARKMIQEVEEEGQAGTTEIELIKDLSLKYNIMSRYTSFIGVDEGSDKVDKVGEMLVRRVDNMRPHGFGGVNMMAVASAISPSNCLGSRRISYSGSSSEDEEFHEYCSDFGFGDEEEEDCDMSFGLFDDDGEKEEIESFSTQPAKSEGNDNKISGKTLHDKMMALMTLQSASGHFAENKMIGDILGKPLEDLKAEVPDSKPETMKSWLTAVVIAFLEVKCQEEKDLSPPGISPQG